MAAVIVSNGATSLATATGFYRSEANNLGMFSATDLILTSTRTIAFTPANAGNCQGVILALVASNTTPKDVVVTLEEFVAAVWTARATVTLTAATIHNGTAAANLADGWIVPFTGGTFPYAVTALPAIWRFSISQTGAASGNWSLRTSDATNPFYVMWCDNAVTFASNDVVVAKDIVTIDATATFKGVLGTGDTTRSVCAIACRSTTPTVGNQHMFDWGTAAAYTLTVDGLFVLSAHAGIRAGASGSPITLANQGILDVIAATSGTAANSGLSGPEHSVGSNQSRASVVIYGEIPSPDFALLGANASVGAASITTNVSTGWQNGDRIFIGGQDVKGVGERTIYTVGVVAGTSVPISPNIATRDRKTGGAVVLLSRCGFVVRGPNTGTGITQHVGMLSAWILSGVHVQFINWGIVPGNVPGEDVANASGLVWSHTVHEGSASTTALTNVTSSNIPIPIGSYSITDCRYVSIGRPTTTRNTSGASTLTETGNIYSTPGPAATAATGVYGVAFGATHVFTGNIIENTTQISDIIGSLGTYTGNVWWGCSGIAYRLSGAVGMTLGGNSIDNCSNGIRFTTNAVLSIDTDSTWGTRQANTVDIAIGLDTGTFMLHELVSPTGNLSISAGIASFVPGSHLRIVDHNDVSLDDRGLLPYGEYQRTGTGLGDTTVRTAGFALRIKPTSGTNLIAWPNLTTERAIPTGNIQNATMSISCWIYINNAAFYAGTHVKPTLNVKYDGLTTVSSVATGTAGAWQILTVTFTPTTTTGQVEMWITGATDATGTNAYFYIDDINVAFPAGSIVNLGLLDLWAHAAPVWPPSASISLSGVMDEAVETDDTGHVVTVREALRLANAANAGKVDGALNGSAGTAHLRNLADTANRVTATYDANGNRTAVTRVLT